MRWAAVLCVALLASAASAQAPGDTARAAAEQLEAAGAALSEAKGARNRVAALTGTVRAYERGLAAMREGLRGAALEERRLRARLDGKDERLADLLSVLSALERAPDAQSLLHPGGALPSARAGMLVADVVPSLQAEAAALAEELQTLETLVALQSSGLQTLEDGLAQVREARLALSTAVSERTDLPPALATDAAAIEALINSTETLAAFADALVGSADESLTRLAPPWNLPAAGPVLRRFNEADAAGIRRPGWIIATEPQALVTSPVPATVRYAGPLAGHGTVVILEPASTQLVILAGLGDTFVVRDQIVSAGDPIGWMSGETPSAQENLIETAAVAGQPSSETLYMEIRQIQKPVDPAIYFSPVEN